MLFHLDFSVCHFNRLFLEVRIRHPPPSSINTLSRGPHTKIRKELTVFLMCEFASQAAFEDGKVELILAVCYGIKLLLHVFSKLSSLQLLIVL